MQNSQHANDNETTREIKPSPRTILSARKKLFQASLPPRIGDDPQQNSALTDMPKSWEEFKSKFPRAAKNVSKGQEENIYKKILENDFTCPYGSNYIYLQLFWFLHKK